MPVADTATLAGRVIGLFADPAELQVARRWRRIGLWNSTGNESVIKRPVCMRAGWLQTPSVHPARLWTE